MSEKNQNIELVYDSEGGEVSESDNESEHSDNSDQSSVYSVGEEEPDFGGGAIDDDNAAAAEYFVPEQTGGDDDDDSDDEVDENYLQKFDQATKQKVIETYHPELHKHNYDEVDILTRTDRNPEGVVTDLLHKTLPFLTKYEKARILGERAKQLDAGAQPFIQVDPTVIDSYLIALSELEQKKIPFIVKRPLPNGGCEYWKLKDLEFL
jgi:DNA-directed RNA polymerase I, II, and III subunit RPABC2